MTMSDEQARAAAEKRLKAQQGFKVMLGGFVILWIITTAIWALSGGGYFWPMWVIFGTGIAALFSGWSAYGPRQNNPSDAQISAEARKMQGG